MAPTIGISASSASRREAQIWLYLGLILLIQVGLILLDATPRYRMGDSASFLWSMFNGGPSDRSWTYPIWFLRPLLVSFRSLNLVVYVQCAIGVIPAWLAFMLVAEGRGGRSALIAFAAAFLCMIEPLALAFQRFFLSDSLGLAAAAAALFCCVRAIDGSAPPAVSAALAPPFMVLAASLRPAQFPSLAMLCLFMLGLLFLFLRAWRAGAAMVVSLVLSQAVYSHYAMIRQGAAGYNPTAGQFLLAAALPIVSRADVEPYIDPARTPAILDDTARDRRARPLELFGPNFAAAQIRRASENWEGESHLAGRIAVHAILRDPAGFLGLGWSTYLDYFDWPYMRDRVSRETGKEPLDDNALSVLAAHKIGGAMDTAFVSSPVRSYFKAALRYYGLIPALSVLLLAAAFILDRRLPTIMIAGFALLSAASHILLSTEPVPRYLIVAAWGNIVVAGRIACALAGEVSSSPGAAQPAVGIAVAERRAQWMIPGLRRRGRA